MTEPHADRVREFEWLIGFAVVAVQVDRDGNLGVLWLQKDGQPVRVQVAQSDSAKHVSVNDGTLDDLIYRDEPSEPSDGRPDA